MADTKISEMLSAAPLTGAEIVPLVQGIPLDNVQLTSADFIAQILAVNTASNEYTVATLPTPSIGMRVYVTDALTPTFGAEVVGEGAVVIPVFYNGSIWIVG